MLEWISAAIGLAIAIGTLAFLGSRLMSHADATPALSARIDRIVEGPAGYTVEVTIRNESQAAAAAVEVEGTLTENGREVRRSLATIDYVPGDSERHAGLVFDAAPTDRNLNVRVVGYTEP